MGRDRGEEEACRHKANRWWQRQQKGNSLKARRHGRWGQGRRAEETGDEKKERKGGRQGVAEGGQHKNEESVEEGRKLVKQ